MSAVTQLQPVRGNATGPEVESRPGLRAVPRAGGRMARIPFLAVLAVVMGLGMVGLLLLNTTLQAQAYQLNELERQSANLSYTEGELAAKVDEVGSVQALSRAATALGMRPNDHVAFLRVPDGAVLGKPGPAGDNYAEGQLVKSPEQLREEARQAAEQESRKRVEEATEAKADQRADIEKRRAEAARKAEAEKAAADKAAADKLAAEQKKAEQRKEADRKEPARAAEPAPARPIGDTQARQQGEEATGQQNRSGQPNASQGDR